MKTIEGYLSGNDFAFAVVISRFNELITQKLLDGALDCLIRHGASTERIHVIWVPGSFEIPMVARKIVKSNQYDAVICLGAIIRGDTPHFDFVAAEAAKGIASVGFDSHIPVTFGVLTTDSIEQAIERAGTKSGNKGWDAALSAIELANLYHKLKE